MKAKNVIDHYAPQHEEKADYLCCANESGRTKVAEFQRFGLGNIFKPELTGRGRMWPAALAYFAVSAATGTSMSSLRMTRFVALSVASSKPWPCVMASVGQASTQ